MRKNTIIFSALFVSLCFVFCVVETTKSTGVIQGVTSTGDVLNIKVDSSGYLYSSFATGSVNIMGISTGTVNVQRLNTAGVIDSVTGVTTVATVSSVTNVASGQVLIRATDGLTGAPGNLKSIGGGLYTYRIFYAALPLTTQLASNATATIYAGTVGFLTEVCTIATGTAGTLEIFDNASSSGVSKISLGTPASANVTDCHLFDPAVSFTTSISASSTVGVGTSTFFFITQ